MSELKDVWFVEAAVEEHGFVKLKSTGNTVRTLGSSDELGKQSVSIL